MAPTIRDIKVICTAPEGINLVVVKVETSEPGLYGLGCATFAYRHLTVQHLIETYLRPLLIGKDVRNISDLWQLMHQNAYWRCGPIVNNAISGVDMALWDIKGKMANMPVYDLFGGKMRAGVPVYRHVDGADVDEICENIEKYRSIGVKHIRCQCGGYGGGGFGPAPEWAAKGAEPGVYLDSKKYMRDTLKLFDGIRAKEGFDIDLVHDVHERIHPTEAVTFVKEMEPYKLFFMEDVVPLEQVEWLDKIQADQRDPAEPGRAVQQPCRVQEAGAEPQHRLHARASEPGGRHHPGPQAADVLRAVWCAHLLARPRRYEPAGPCSQHPHRSGRSESGPAGVERHRTAQLRHPEAEG